MATVNIVPVKGSELYCKYPRQTSPQPCYIELDCATGRFSASYNADVGNGHPMEVHNGIKQRWAISALKADAANALLQDMAEKAQIICDGFCIVWDGHNHVADFTQEAQDAIDFIQDEIYSEVQDENAQIQVWDAADWFASIGGEALQCKDLGITATMADNELKALGISLLESARSDGVDDIEGLSEHLEQLRTWIKEHA